MNFNWKILSGAVLVLTASLLVIWKSASDKPSAEPATPREQPAAASETRQQPTRPPSTTPAGLPKRLPDAEARKAIPANPEARQAAKEKIDEAATTYDPAQLPVIRPYLVSADPELREAAVDAMIVLGDAAAGPMLREAAARMQSEVEAKAMLKAANYVELPPANLREWVKKGKRKPADVPSTSEQKK